MSKPAHDTLSSLSRLGPEASDDGVLKLQIEQRLLEAAAVVGEQAGGGEGPAGADVSPYTEIAGKTFLVPADPAHGKPMLLADFAVRIVREIHRIKYADASLEFDVAATHADGSTASRIVAAGEYARMEWPKALGAKFVVATGRGVRDHLRCVIQSLIRRDGPIPRHTVCKEIGCAEVDGREVILHRRGAVGPDGTVPVRVALGGNLEHIELPDRRLTRPGRPPPATAAGGPEDGRLQPPAAKPRGRRLRGDRRRRVRPRRRGHPAGACAVRQRRTRHPGGRLGRLGRPGGDPSRGRHGRTGGPGGGRPCVTDAPRPTTSTISPAASAGWSRRRPAQTPAGARPSCRGAPASSSQAAATSTSQGRTTSSTTAGGSRSSCKAGRVDPRDISYDGAWPELLEPEPGVIDWCDSRAAIAQGWEIFYRDAPNTDGEIWELQRLDEDGRFNTDSEAWAFVWRRAVGDRDPVAQRALAFLYYRAPGEYQRIRNHNLL